MCNKCNPLSTWCLHSKPWVGYRGPISSVSSYGLGRLRVGLVFRFSGGLIQVKSDLKQPTKKFKTNHQPQKQICIKTCTKIEDGGERVIIIFVRSVVVWFGCSLIPLQQGLRANDIMRQGNVRDIEARRRYDIGKERDSV